MHNDQWEALRKLGQGCRKLQTELGQGGNREAMSNESGDVGRRVGGMWVRERPSDASGTQIYSRVLLRSLGTSADLNRTG